MRYDEQGSEIRTLVDNGNGVALTHVQAQHEDERLLISSEHQRMALA